MKLIIVAGSIAFMVFPVLAQTQGGRKALASDVAFINDPKNALLKIELDKLGLSPKPNLRSLCKIYLPVSDISLGTNRYQTDKAHFDLPFSKVLMWDVTRPFPDSQLYNIFAVNEINNADAWINVPAGQDADSWTTEGHNFIGRPLGYFPDENQVTSDRSLFDESARIPFDHNGNSPPDNMYKWSNFMVHDYVIPETTSNNFRTYTEISLKTTCMVDVHKDSNCICADSE